MLRVVDGETLTLDRLPERLRALPIDRQLHCLLTAQGLSGWRALGQALGRPDGAQIRNVLRGRWRSRPLVEALAAWAGIEPEEIEAAIPAGVSRET